MLVRGEAPVKLDLLMCDDALVATGIVAPGVEPLEGVAREPWCVREVECQLDQRGPSGPDDLAPATVLPIAPLSIAPPIDARRGCGRTDHRGDGELRGPWNACRSRRTRRRPLVARRRRCARYGLPACARRVIVRQRLATPTSSGSCAGGHG